MQVFEYVINKNGWNVSDVVKAVESEYDGVCNYIYHDGTVSEEMD
jgi:hypothetical protein